MTLSAIAFIESTLINPETTGEPFVLTDAERVFLTHAFAIGPDGRALYPELVFGAPKKSGKTALAALALLYVVRVLGGKFSEGYVLSNSREQAANRVFLAAARIVEASPLLARDAKVTQEKIVFKSTGATIAAIAADYSTAAGANPMISSFDELWAYTTELDTRLWDEMVPPPTRPMGWRLTTTYAGFEGESGLLEGVYKRGLQGEQIAPALYAQPGMLMLWTHEFTAPWQTAEWRDQMRAQLRLNAYLRLVENRWVSSETTFIDLEVWDACVDAAASQVVADRRLPVWVGVDASVRRDSTAIVAVTWDQGAQNVRIVAHRIFQPAPGDPIDFEEMVEATLLDFARRFSVREVRYDPYQMQAVAQRLIAKRLPMVEFGQTTANLTAASTGLYELITGRNLVAYPDPAIRLAIQRAVAVETARGWRIAKDKAAHRIDVVVALAQAAFGAVQESMSGPSLIRYEDIVREGDGPGPAKIWAVAGVVQVAPDGGVGVAYFLVPPPILSNGTLWLADFEAPHLTPRLFSDVAARLDELAEEYREAKRGQPVHVEFWVPDAYQPRAFDALREAFARHHDRIERRAIICDSLEGGIDRPVLADAARQHYLAAVHIQAERVRMTPQAIERMATLPIGLFGAIGDHHDPVSSAIWLGVILALEGKENLTAPAWPGARMAAA